ncbi:hypothetical protein ACQR1W_31450 [Bradyrhizobium sp. HKCCYLS1011]|uniref:hypothetical protein n=1 Tax=Bradyrhizobium sp. HKCCYLS1011 TaxID=3420733 RepID=UPI003EC0E93E
MIKERCYVLCIGVYAICTAVAPTLAAQADFELAEQKLADCAARADLHPPYGPGNTVMDVCQHAADAYQAACVASGHSGMECGLAAGALANSMQKHDPVDEQFIQCLEKAGRRGALPLELLTLCRAERHAFEDLCRRRKDIDRCERDAETLARAVCVSRSFGADTCQVAP